MCIRDRPHIRSPEGYIIPLSIEQGLPILEMRPPTDLEMESLTHIYLTADNDWLPDIYDHQIPDRWSEDFTDPVDPTYVDRPIDRYGHYQPPPGHPSETIEGATRDYFTRAEIEVHLTQQIADELIDSVIEYDTGDCIYHREPTSDDDSCDWGDWRGEAIDQPRDEVPSDNVQYSFDVRGRPRTHHYQTFPAEVEPSPSPDVLPPRLRRSGTNYARGPPVPKRTRGRAKTRVEKPDTDMQRAARGESLAPTVATEGTGCLLYTSPSPRDLSTPRMPSSA